MKEEITQDKFFVRTVERFSIEYDDNKRKIMQWAKGHAHNGKVV